METKSFETMAPFTKVELSLLILSYILQILIYTKLLFFKSLLWNKPLLPPLCFLVFFFFFLLNCTDLFHFQEYLDLVSEAT